MKSNSIVLAAALIPCLSMAANPPTPITPGWEPTPQELGTLNRVLQLPGMGLDLTGWSIQVYRGMDHPMHPIDWSPGREDWEHWSDVLIPAGSTGTCVKGAIRRTAYKRLRILHMTRADIDYHNANIGRWIRCGFQYYGNYHCENLAALVIHERFHLAPYNWSHPSGDVEFQPLVDQRLAEFVAVNGFWLSQNTCDWR